MLRGIADCLGEAFAIAIIDAAIRNVTNNVAAEFVESVFFVDDKLGVDLLGIGLEAVATCFVFDVWMDVRIVPKKRRLDAFGTQAVNTINAAWSAAGVH